MKEPAEARWTGRMRDDGLERTVRVGRVPTAIQTGE
jgi:hypothetical protein